MLQNNPDDKGALHNASIVYLSLKDSVNARVTLNHLQRFYPDYPDGYLIDGGYQLQKGDTLRAMQLFEKAKEMAPGLSGAYLSIASILYDKGEFGKAEQNVSVAIDNNPNNPILYVNRALTRFRQNNIRGAMQDYSTAIEIDPSNSMARYNRALLRTQVGEQNAALNDFTYLLQLDPYNYFVLFNRGVIANNLGHPEIAERDMDRILLRYPTFVPAYTERAEAKRALGRTLAAKQDLHYASKLMYDPEARKSAITEQDAITAESSEAVRDERDDNIRKFRLLVHNSQSKGYNKLYEEGQSVRGRVQDRKVRIELEPMYTLSYYEEIDEKLRVSSSQQFSRSLGLVVKQEGLQPKVVRHVPQLTPAQIQKHLAEIEQQNERNELGMEYAMNLLTIKNYDAVVGVLSKILEKEPNNIVALFQLATSRYYSTLLLLANEEENKKNNTQQPPVIPELNVRRDNDLVKTKAIKQSIADLEKVLALLPNYPPALYNIAFLYGELAQYDASIRYYTMAINAEPKMGAAYFNRGLMYYYIGDKKEAEKNLSRSGSLGFIKAYSIMREMK